MYNFRIAFEAMKANKVRSLLTSLGIIFGVASVITMLAVGEGTQKEILEQMKLVGVNNIVITPILKSNKEDDGGSDASSTKEKAKFSRGLTLEDAKAIAEVLPSVGFVVPEVSYETALIEDGRTRHANLVGVNPEFFRIQNLRSEKGNLFTDLHSVMTKPVCVIGSELKKFFFSDEEAIGKHIKCGKTWFEVIGVLKALDMGAPGDDKLHISDYNNQVYAPLETVLVRHKNRSLVTQKSVQGGGGGGGMFMMGGGDDGSSNTTEKPNYNQLDRITVQVKETEQLRSSAEVITRLLKRRHSEVEDFEVSIPELLLKQQANTKDRLKFLLACIAGISLLVGGIGIMNIMLATVMERIKEIGIRLSVGATKKDIVIQFMAESVFLSVAGGIIGILLGVGFSWLIPLVVEQTPTIISVFSIILSFVVSATVGIIFGFMPAKRAAELDPILSLRHD
jgi:putative ABC transport system permease protein